MTQYRVIVTLYVEADDRRQAAILAYDNLNALTPTKFDVKDPASVSKEIELTEEEVEEVLNRPLEGNEGRPGLKP